MPDVTVVIPSFNRPSETARAVRSALSQTGISVEVVVVDDASPDPLDLPSDLTACDRVRVLRLPANRGPAGARNAGVEVARGSFIAFLDSDDFFLPNTLAPRLAWLRDQRKSGPAMGAAPVWRWRPGLSAALAVPIGAFDVELLSSGCWYFPGSTALFSRTTWATVGPLDTQLRRLEDLDWGIRLAQAGGEVLIAPIPAAVVQRSSPAGLKAVSAAAKEIERRFAPGAAAGLGKAAYRRLRAYLALEQASSAYGEHHGVRFARELIRSFALQPRLTLHQHRWWSQRPASDDEITEIEALARRWT